MDKETYARLYKAQRQLLRDDYACWRWEFMNKEERKEFERFFKEKMKIYCKDYNIKATNDGITFFDNQKKRRGEISLEYSPVDYCLRTYVEEGEIADFLARACPEREKELRLYSSSYSINQTRKQFSDTSLGKVRKIPEESREEFAERVAKRVMNIILPHFFDIMHVRPSLLEKITQEPFNYFEPIITYLYVARKYGFDPETPFVKRIFTAEKMYPHTPNKYKEEYIYAFEKRLYAGEFDDIIEAYKEVGKGDNYVNITLKAKK